MCREIKAHSAEILQKWDELASSEPWIRMPEEWRIDHLPKVIEGLADLAFTPDLEEEEVRAWLEEVSRHGTDRRRQEVDEVLLFREYHYLWRALRSFVGERFGDEGDRSTQALLRLDASLGLATRASLLGYYRDELEQQRRWPKALERLVREFPLPA